MTAHQPAKSRVRIVGLCGSLREGSYSRRAVEIALEGAGAAGVETMLIDLRDYKLVFYGSVPDEEFPDDVHRLRADVRAAQGIILATPEYHGGLSGVLKNALDLMRFDEFEGKMIGLIGVSGGRLGAVNALNSLRTIGRTLHAWVLPQQVSIPEAWRCFDEQGNITDEELAQRLAEVGLMVARFATLHELQKGQEFIKLWEELPSNPGGKLGE